MVPRPTLTSIKFFYHPGGFPLQFPYMKRILAFGGLIATLGVSQALSISVGVGPQRENYRGWIKYKGTAVDLKDDLHLEDKTKYFVYADLKHNLSLIFIPIPDLRLEFLKVDTSGTGKVSREFTIGGKTFTVNQRIYTKVKFDQYDALFYYTPLSVKVASLSWGFGVKVIDFSESVRSLDNPALSQSYSATVPLPYLYARAGVNLPFVHASLEGKGLKVGGSYFYDWVAKAGLSYTKGILTLSLDGGYRFQRYRIDDIEDISSDVKIKGPFAALSLTLSF